MTQPKLVLSVLDRPMTRKEITNATGISTNTLGQVMARLERQCEVEVVDVIDTGAPQFVNVYKKMP